MKWLIAMTLVALLILYIFLSGMIGVSGLVLWIYWPLIAAIGWALLNAYKEKHHFSASFWGFALGVNLFMMPIHIEWYLNIDGIRTSSSTSGLMFVWLPIWSALSGGILAGVFALVGRFIKR